MTLTEASDHHNGDTGTGNVKGDLDKWRAPITATVRSKKEGSIDENRTVTLQPLTEADLDGYYNLHSDARLWDHFPSGRHTSLTQSQKELGTWVEEWKTGLCYWSVKDEQGVLIGVGGARPLKGGQGWNIYYRVAFDWWGWGIASIIAKRGYEAAKDYRPDLPIVAYLVDYNIGSRTISEKVLGMQLRWTGPDAGNPDPKVTRLVFSDRPLSPEVLKVVTT